MWRYRHILALQKIAIYGEAHVFSPAADFRSPLIFAFDRPLYQVIFGSALDDVRQIWNSGRAGGA
jgi:hypothetical protein